MSETVRDELESCLTHIPDDFINIICSHIESWQITEKDNKSFEEPYTAEQVDYFNRGVMSVKHLLEAVKDGSV